VKQAQYEEERNSDYSPSEYMTGSPEEDFPEESMPEFDEDDVDYYTDEPDAIFEKDFDEDDVSYNPDEPEVLLDSSEDCDDTNEPHADDEHDAPMPDIDEEEPDKYSDVGGADLLEPLIQEVKQPAVSMPQCKSAPFRRMNVAESFSPFDTCSSPRLPTHVEPDPITRVSASSRKISTSSSAGGTRTSPDPVTPLPRRISTGSSTTGSTRPSPYPVPISSVSNRRISTGSSSTGTTRPSPTIPAHAEPAPAAAPPAVAPPLLGDNQLLQSIAMMLQGNPLSIKEQKLKVKDVVADWVLDAEAAETASRTPWPFEDVPWNDDNAFETYLSNNRGLKSVSIHIYTLAMSRFHDMLESVDGDAVDIDGMLVNSFNSDVFVALMGLPIFDKTR
jgi:hypothetical protein